MSIEKDLKIWYDVDGERTKFWWYVKKARCQMTKKDLAAKVAAYNEYKAILKEAENELGKLEADLKKELDRKGVNELDVGEFKVRWTPMVSKRFDSKGFKAAEPDLYEAWTKEVESRRFSVV